LVCVSIRIVQLQVAFLSLYCVECLQLQLTVGGDWSSCLSISCQRPFLHIFVHLLLSIVSWLSSPVLSMHIRYHTTAEHCHSYVSTINTWLCVNLNTHSSDFTSMRPIGDDLQLCAGLCVHLWAMCLKSCLVSESRSECDYNLSGGVGINIALSRIVCMSCSGINNLSYLLLYCVGNV